MTRCLFLTAAFAALLASLPGCDDSPSAGADAVLSGEVRIKLLYSYCHTENGRAPSNRVIVAMRAKDGRFNGLMMGDPSDPVWSRGLEKVVLSKRDILSLAEATKAFLDQHGSTTEFTGLTQEEIDRMENDTSPILSYWDITMTAGDRVGQGISERFTYERTYSEHSEQRAGLKPEFLSLIERIESLHPSGRKLDQNPVSSVRDDSMFEHEIYRVR